MLIKEESKSSSSSFIFQGVVSAMRSLLSPTEYEYEIQSDEVQKLLKGYQLVNNNIFIMFWTIWVLRPSLLHCFILISVLISSTTPTKDDLFTHWPNDQPFIDEVVVKYVLIHQNNDKSFLPRWQSRVAGVVASPSHGSCWNVQIIKEKYKSQPKNNIPPLINIS